MTTSWTNKTPSSAPTWTSQSRNAASWTNKTPSLENTTASAGLYTGHGLITYSGGETLPPTPPIWTNLTTH